MEFVNAYLGYIFLRLCNITRIILQESFYKISFMVPTGMRSERWALLVLGCPQLAGGLQSFVSILMSPSIPSHVTQASAPFHLPGSRSSGRSCNEL